MAHKTLTISEEAYKSLVTLKKEGESFTDVINRITGLVRKKPLKDFAGRLKDDKFEIAATEIRSSGSDMSRLESAKL
ncbi:MAG: antitoxin VapB family protein [Methanosarcinales archaeon]|jgi:predicted CopG family antitoxin